MTKAESIANTLEWGISAVKEFKNRGEAVPQLVYDRMVELVEELVKEVQKKV